ncbi:MAG: ribonuclease Z [Candidatus Nanoarchaeia archaeon]|nr:ribonuclease Z [Candidatus Nanoarchaeia archaeon]
MKITFLGTSSSIPTKERNHSAFLLSYKTENILFDCGENVQRQLTIAKISPAKITKILISHWHGDHVLGIPGLLTTIGNISADKIVEIYGPEGTKKQFEYVKKAFLTETIPKVKIIEIKKVGKFFENHDFCLDAQKLKHPIPCLAFSFIEKDKLRINKDKLKQLKIPKGPIIKDLTEGKNIKLNNKVIRYKEITYLQKGKKLTYLSNTGVSPSCIKAAKNADVIISEATFSKADEKKAIEYQHLTSEQAAQIAKKAKAKKLILTHFSPRYKDTKDLEKEAKTIFKNTECASDFISFSF